MMMPFKITSGFYHNLTYLNGEIVNMDFNKIQESDIKWLNIVGSDRWFEKSDSIKHILFEKVDVIYNGKSLIDGSPIFLIDVDKESRNIIINNVLK